MGTWGLGIFDNDAACDFLLEVTDEGLPLLKSAVNKLRQIAIDDELERDDASVVLAIAAICLAKHGIILPDLKDVEGSESALNACRGKITSRTLRDVAWLVEQVLANSELRELWEEAGLLPKWRTKMCRLIRLISKTIETTS